MNEMGKSIQPNLTYWEIVAVSMLFTIVEGAVPNVNCSVSQCYDGGPAIHFPFWLKQSNSAGQSSDDCSSLPGFQLSCGKLYNKHATILELQHLVNSSIEGLQLSFIYEAAVAYIDYTNEEIYLYDTPYLTSIVPTPVRLNSSSTPYQLPFDRYDQYLYRDLVSKKKYLYRDYYDSSNLNYPFYCYPYEKMIRDPFLNCDDDQYDRIRGYTFFNCSSSSAGNTVNSSLNKDFKDVHAFPSFENPIQMLPDIKSCTKLYNISGKLPYFLQSCKRRQIWYGQSHQRLSWSTELSGGKCEAVQKSCKFEDHDRNTTGSTPYFQPPPPIQPPPPRGSDHTTTKRLVAVLLPCIFLVVFGLIFLYNFIRLDKQKKVADELKIKMFMEDYKALKPTRYSYSDIKKITNMFKHKLGQGGYGSVFKGQISSDILVAVKVLHIDSKANGDDFVNEVSTIGKIHHVNVVRLLGYCADGCNRALVYEFQPNHSLEKFVYRREKPQRFIGWKRMQKIALGIAKGIRYLHHGCAQQILHFDIKPNNILLDQNFNPKISDFGLAKLCNKGQSIVSMTAARGTIGYIAPEVFSRNFGNVSTKSDVYSFGMLLLEMVGGKDNDVAGEQNTSDVYFPEWIFHRLEKGGELVIQIENEDDSKIARKLTIVGLWCIRWHPIDRPSMKLVIQMLEADESPAMPPNPFSSTTSGKANHAKSFFSEGLHVISEAE